MTDTPHFHSETTDRRLSLLLSPLLSIQRSSWEQGVAAQAFLECHKSPVVSSDNYLELVYGLAHDAIVRQAPDGRLAVVLNGDGTSDPGALDPACIGESFYYLCKGKMEGRTIDLGVFEGAVDKMLRYILDSCPRASIRAVDGSSNTASDVLLLSHRVDVVQIWSDAVYMLSPFLAAAAVHHQCQPDTKSDADGLLQMALQQIILSAEALQSSKGEWSHIYNLQTRKFEREAFWGVGNGWVCGGIVRVFRTLAETAEKTREGKIAQLLAKDTNTISQLRHCYKILRETLDACLRHMRSDGLFHDIVDDPTTFVETNLSQQLCYVIFRLLDLHLYSSSCVMELLHLPGLTSSTVDVWESRVQRMYQAAVEKTDDWGFVRGVCGSPRFNHAGTAAEGQAWAILMEVARGEYLSHKCGM